MHHISYKSCQFQLPVYDSSNNNVHFLEFSLRAWLIKLRKNDCAVHMNSLCLLTGRAHQFAPLIFEPNQQNEYIKAQLNVPDAIKTKAYARKSRKQWLMSLIMLTVFHIGVQLCEISKRRAAQKFK